MSIGRVLTTAIATARRLAESRHLTIVSDFDDELGDVLLTLPDARSVITTAMAMP